MTQDPIGLAGGVNLYSYAGSNPVAFTDPFGLQASRCWVWSDRDSPACIEARRMVENAPTVALEVPAIGPGGRGLVKWARSIPGTARRVASIVRHAGDLRGYLIHLRPSDLAGAARELRNLESGGEHLQEVREAVGGIRIFIQTMKNALANPELTAIERGAFSRLLGIASRALDKAEDALRVP